jgi:hypothetical protein
VRVAARARQHPGLTAVRAAAARVARLAGLGQPRRHRAHLLLARTIGLRLLHQPVDEGDQPEDRDLHRDDEQNYR